ncbi:response regulator [Oscillatoria salina]|uniref:response regulator n=1 Tax=Oscillatoria salina TaxID=331517 RepID=UPI0013BCEE26|nr:response regulator [Oscillatoria salina]MBZ8182698.1 response regulator [Oscillatoria salina IIICB1]NET87485.1 response regulator [Kamptonema sp. SIO1D9]
MNSWKTNSFFTAIYDILIVDDQPENLRLLSSILSEQGYKVRRVINGNLALNAAQLEPPDLILLDITMPEINGYEVCEKLKQKPETKEIPVIFLSAKDDLFDKVLAFEVGGADYITKPFYVQEVILRVRNQLILHQQQKQLIEEIRARQEAESALKKAELEITRLTEKLENSHQK